MPKVNLGRIRTVFKGEWVPGTCVIDDVVLYAGSAYTCIAIAASGNDPTDAAFWIKSAGGTEFMGVWDTAVAYKINQIVTLNGSTFIAVSVHTGIQPAAAGNAGWALYASGGDIADQTNKTKKFLTTDGTATSWQVPEPGIASLLKFS